MDADKKWDLRLLHSFVVSWLALTSSEAGNTAGDDAGEAAGEVAREGAWEAVGSCPIRAPDPTELCGSVKPAG